MSLSYKGENIPKMYEELIPLRAQLGEVESYLGGGDGNAVQAARMVVDELNEKRAQLERARDALVSAHCDCTTMRGKNYICKRCLALRELENGGGDDRT